MFFFIGDTVAVVAKINNASSRDMVPKFSLIRDVYYHAEGSTKHENKVIYKQIDDLIQPNTEKTVKCAIKIPKDVTPTINSCPILSLEYHVKVCILKCVIVTQHCGLILLPCEYFFFIF